MRPHHHVEELLFVMISGWVNKTDLFSRKQYFVHFEESPFGKDHIILAPIAKFDDEAANPHWDHSPVPYCYNDEVKWRS